MTTAHQLRKRWTAAHQFTISIVISLSLLLVFLIGCSQQQDEQNISTSPIRIGAVLPLSGNSAAWGEQGRWGIEMAITKANEAGSISGHRIEVIFEDSQATPRIALTAFNKLTQVDGVDAVVGDIVSATTLAMAPLAEERNVTLIAPTASAPAITNAGTFIFRVWPSDLLEGVAAADWARAQHIDKVAILHIANDYGAGLATTFRTQLEGTGGQIVSVQSYAQDQTDFKPYLTRVKYESPDLIYIISYYKDAGLILKQAREMGIATRFLGATAVESPDLLLLAGSAAEGLVYPTIVDFDPSNPTPHQKVFIDEFTKMYGKSPDWASSHAHDAMLVIIEALKSGARTGDEIRAYIDKRRIFEGLTGKIHFNDNGDVIDKPIVMKEVRDGKFVVLSRPR